MAFYSLRNTLARVIMHYERREDEAVGVTQNPKDATFGGGVYLTTCTPGTLRAVTVAASITHPVELKGLCRPRRGIDRTISGGMMRQDKPLHTYHNGFSWNVLVEIPGSGRAAQCSQILSHARYPERTKVRRERGTLRMCPMNS